MGRNAHTSITGGGGITSRGRDWHDANRKMRARKISAPGRMVNWWLAGLLARSWRALGADPVCETRLLSAEVAKPDPQPEIVRSHRDCRDRVKRSAMMTGMSGMS